MIGGAPRFSTTPEPSAPIDELEGFCSLAADADNLEEAVSAGRFMKKQTSSGRSSKRCFGTSEALDAADLPI